MPLTVSNNTGDGITATLINAAIMIPSAGSTVNLEGFVQFPGLASQYFNTSVTAPAIPGSGSTYWNIQVDYTTGTASVQTSAVADPAPLANNVVIFRQTLTFAVSNANLSLDPESTPDTY